MEGLLNLHNPDVFYYTSMIMFSTINNGRFLFSI